MTDYRASDRDVSRAIRSWLHEDRHEDASRLAGAVLDRVETTSQRRATWWPAWRTPHMNKIIATGLGVAAVVALLLVGSTLFGFFGSRVGGPPSEPAVPSEPPSSVEPSGTGDGSLLVGIHVMDPVGGNDLIDDRVTVTIPAAGWFAAPDEGSITKDLGRFGLVTLVAVPGDHYKVPRNICDWQTDPGADGARIAESVGELVAYLTEQTYDLEGSLTRDILPPENITVDGFSGQLIMDDAPSYPDSDPTGCDEQRFCSLLDRDGAQCLLSHTEPGALDTVWIVDTGTYLRVIASIGWPNTEFRAEELGPIVRSMIFH